MSHITLILPSLLLLNWFTCLPRRLKAPLRQVLHHIFLSVPQDPAHCLEKSRHPLTYVCRIMARHTSKRKAEKGNHTRAVGEAHRQGVHQFRKRWGHIDTSPRWHLRSRSTRGSSWWPPARAAREGREKSKHQGARAGSPEYWHRASGLCLALNNSSQQPVAPHLHLLLPQKSVSGTPGPCRTRRVSLSH